MVVSITLSLSNTINAERIFPKNLWHKQYPLTILTCARGNPVLIEMKSGETYNGCLDKVDHWMNIHLKDCICTSKDGERFWKIPEAYIRGNSIKFLRVPDELAETVRQEMERQKKQQPPPQHQQQHSARGFGRGGQRGRGGGGRGRGGP